MTTDGYPISDPFDIGVHRPVYLWAGPGTVRMNRLKFMGAPVDEAVHADAHTPVAVRRMSEEAAFSWAYLMYDWGFPPEVEQEDWLEFRRAAEVYHRAGMQVFGYEGEKDLHPNIWGGQGAAGEKGQWRQGSAQATLPVIAGQR